MIPTLMAESKEELKRLLKVKEESEKAGSKLNSQKTKIMASSPITSWQIEGEKEEAVTDGDCSHEIKRHLLLGRKAMANLDSVLKIRDIILPTKGPHRQSYGFQIVMCRYESWLKPKN